MPIRGVEFDSTDDVSFQRKRWELRSDLPGCRQRYYKKRKASRSFKVLTLLLVAVVGYYVTENIEVGDGLLPPATLKRQATSESVPGAPLEFTPPSSAREKSVHESSANTPASRAGETLAASLSVHTASQTAAPEKARPSVEVFVPAVVSATILPSASDSVSTVASLDTPKSIVVMAATSEPPSPPMPPSARIRVTQSLACLEVEARQCTGNQSVFALHEHNTPHIWMNVHSQSLPYVLKHIYYHEGKQFAEIPLAITYPRMRTWSSVTLQSPTRVGSWRVAIVTEDGDLLDEVMFRVIP